MLIWEREGGVLPFRAVGAHSGPGREHWPSGACFPARGSMQDTEEVSPSLKGFLWVTQVLTGLGVVSFPSFKETAIFEM